MSPKSPEVNNGRKWWAGFILPCVTMVFGAGGATMVLQRDVSRHETQLTALIAQGVNQQVLSAQINQRLLNIEGDIAKIEALLRNGKGPGERESPTR